MIHPADQTIAFRLVGRGELWSIVGMARATGRGRSRPCSVCRRWFVPDPRVRQRQRTCGATECRRALKRRTQRQWSERHPDYWSARRLAERLSADRTSPPTPRGPPPEMRQIPTDIVQDEIGPQALVILLFLAKLHHRVMQDEIRGQLAGMMEEIARLQGREPQDETAAGGRSE